MCLFSYVCMCINQDKNKYLVNLGGGYDGASFSILATFCRFENV